MRKTHVTQRQVLRSAAVAWLLLAGLMLTATTALAANWLGTDATTISQSRIPTKLATKLPTKFVNPQPEWAGTHLI